MALRIAVVVSHPIQHFCPLYQGLAKSPEVALRVFFASRAGLQPYFDPAFASTVSWQPHLTEGFDHEFLDGSTERKIGETVSASDLRNRLTQFDPDAVQVYGFRHDISRIAYWWAVRRGKRILYCSDSEHRQRRPLLSRVRKRLVMPSLFERVDAFLSIGDCNESYYASYGVPRHKIYRCPIPIDQKAIHAARSGAPTSRLNIRRLLGVTADGVLLITVGKLIERKRFEDVIQATSALRRSGRCRNLFLAVLGDGPERPRLESLVESLGVDGIQIKGFIPVTDLPWYYVAADFLVHPASRDPHPLSVGEAVCCGLPVIVSDRVGCVGITDDVQPTRNGIEYRCGDLSDLEQAIHRLASDNELRQRMAKESLAIAETRSLEVSARAVIAAIRAAPRPN